MPQELHSVGDHVNRLLARLAHALDVERALAANAAHELRTPLAAVRLRLTTALEGHLRREDVQAALEALNTLSHRAEKLLQLSRAESGAALGHQHISLEQLAATVAQEFWSLPGLRDRVALLLPEGEEESRTSETPFQQAWGDIDSLAIALRNLVENALRYGGDGPVEITVEAPCTLVVRDHGPGVAPQRLQTLRQRHVRDSAERTGYGLGLSIVATIMERHRGRLELHSPLPASGASGLEARLVLSPEADA
jgi:two-component system, OmpR family, sensor kinase